MRSKYKFHNFDLAKLKRYSFIQSNLFTFRIGEQKKPIVVHAAAIAATSQQLNALINGGMEESQQRCAHIRDVEVNDFLRFCEYAYRGDYTVPPWDNDSCKSVPESPIREMYPPPADPEFHHPTGLELEAPSISMSPIIDIERHRGYLEDEYEAPPAVEPSIVTYHPPYANLEVVEAISQHHSEVKAISRAPLRTHFNNQKYSSDSCPKALILQQFEPKPNNAVYQNYTPVFLAHARLYCFAHVRLIAPLKALILDKLHKTVLNFKLYAERVGDIIELARYAYSNPDLPDRSNDGTLDELRKLVVDYIVCEIDTIGKHEEFVKYLEEGGEFVGDFWKLTREYII